MIRAVVLTVLSACTTSRECPVDQYVEVETDREVSHVEVCDQGGPCVSVPTDVVLTPADPNPLRWEYTETGIVVYCGNYDNVRIHWGGA